MGVGRWLTAVDTVVLAEESGRGAAGGVRDAIAGVRGLHRVEAERRHAAYRTRASVSGEFYHDDADRLDLLARLDADFDKFRADVEPGLATPGVSEARSQWWKVDVLPALTEWKEFLQRESSWLARFATEWSTYAEWLGRLKTMRSDARVQGIALRSPEPAPIPRTLFERGATGFGDRADTVWTTGRVLLYAVLGITGVVALRSAWTDLRDFRKQREESGE